LRTQNAILADFAAGLDPGVPNTPLSFLADFAAELGGTPGTPGPQWPSEPYLHPSQSLISTPPRPPLPPHPSQNKRGFWEIGHPLWGVFGIAPSWKSGLDPPDPAGSADPTLDPAHETWLKEPRAQGQNSQNPMATANVEWSCLGRPNWPTPRSPSPFGRGRARFARPPLFFLLFYQSKKFARNRCQMRMQLAPPANVFETFRRRGPVLTKSLISLWQYTRLALSVCSVAAWQQGPGPRPP
jgi:hypothetical protein